MKIDHRIIELSILLFNTVLIIFSISALRDNENFKKNEALNIKDMSYIIGISLIYTSTRFFIDILSLNRFETRTLITFLIYLINTIIVLFLMKSFSYFQLYFSKIEKTKANILYFYLAIMFIYLLSNFFITVFEIMTI